ncbi:MAG: hypothetical protein KF812_09020 [Fimbriimonadaceae bacterium]|nr:hypothetical protein [Fimbriimonadaceae bacterium]
MRTLFALLLACPTMAFADWNLRTPAGLPVYRNEVRTTFETRKDEQVFGRAAFGFGNGIAVAATTYGGRASGDVSYNYIVPFLDTSPGISVGALDLADEGPGRAIYLAATFRYGNYDPANQDVPTELTVGFISRRGGRGFVSVALPLDETIWLRAEHDGFTPLAAVEYRPVPQFALRGIVDRNGPSLGIMARIQF